MTTVACDVCGERYQVSRSAFGRTQKCKVCLVPFDVCSHTVAPDEDTAKADDEPEPSEFAVVQRAVGTGLTTLALVGCFAWMASLPFRNPRAIPGHVAMASTTVAPVPARTLATPGPRVNAVSAAASPITSSPSSPTASPPDASRFELDKFPDSSTSATKAADGSLANTGGTVRVSGLPNGATNPAMSAVGGRHNYNGPGSIASSGRKVNSVTQLEVQQIVQVQWGSAWFPADVVRINPAGTVRIHYRGWASSFDEDVNLPRIQLAHGAAATPEVKPATQPDMPVLSEDGQPNYEGPGKVPSSGRTVTKFGQLKPGLIVQVVWGGSGVWFPADVVKRNPNGTVRIHYRGRAASFDEDVPLEKIQLAHDGVQQK